MREGIAAGRTFRKSHFRSTLMIGAAGLAAAGVSTAAAAADSPAPAADAPKWLPSASVGGQVGDGVSGAKVDLFVPVWQDLDSLLFVRLGVGTQTRDDEVVNFGLGYRTRIDPSWILGVYGGLDASHTKYGHTFTQGALGAELMSADWDLRINGYLATQRQVKDVANKYALYVHDTRVAVLQGQEGAYSGFDGEVGYRVFSTDDSDFRIFAGGYSFTRDRTHAVSSGQAFDFDFKDIQGPYGRAEVDVYDIDALGPQSRITVTGQISHDDVRGTSGYVGASLRIPLGAGWGQGGQALDELDLRMVDQVRRQDNVLTEWQYSKPEPVIIYNGTVTSEPTNTLYYVDNSIGAGTYADPTTPQDATSRSATNAFIVATDFDGPIVGTGATVQPGQTLVGPGTFRVAGADSHKVFSHDFAPGSGTPTFVAASATDNVIDLASNSTLYGVTISGPFNSGIYGHNISGATITNVAIDASAGKYGVLINQDQSQDLNLHISDSTISGAAMDGVLVSTAVSDGGTSNQTVELRNSTVSGSGLANVALVATVSGGSTVNQNIIVDPTAISGGLYGISLYDYVTGGTLNQDLTLTDLTFTGQTYSGISIDAVAGPGGVLNQAITIDNVTVTGSYAPIVIQAASYYGGQITQRIALSHVTATGATFGDDIEISAAALYGGTVNQTGTWTDVAATNAYDNGVSVAGYAAEGGSVIQNFGISGLTATGNYYDGLRIVGSAFDNAGHYGPSIVAQYLTVADSTLTGNGGGLSARTIAFGAYAATRQDIGISDSTLSGNFTGIVGLAAAVDDGSTQQNFMLSNDTVDSNISTGGEFVAIGYYGGFSAQTISIDNSSFSDNGGDGLDLQAVALLGGNTEQNASIYYSTFDGNAGSGLHIGTISGGYSFGYYVYYGQATQNVIAAYDSFSSNGGDGVYIDNALLTGGQLNQFLYFYHVTLDHNTYNGLLEVTEANSYGPSYIALTNAYSDLYVVGSSASHNGYSGIYVDSYEAGPGYTIQHVNVSGTTANDNGFAGFGDRATAVGFLGLNAQYITLAGSTFDGNGGPGAYFVAYQYYGPGASLGVTVQDVTIVGSDFSHNGSNGLYGYAGAAGYQGRVNQNFTIDGSRFDYNAANGIELVRVARNGSYVAGYGCSVNNQSLYGGCAMIRQTVLIADSDVSYNGLGGSGDGIYVKSIAADYGAIYDTFGRPGIPTLLIYDTTVYGNNGDGLHLYNSVTNDSYLFQYVGILDSTFDYNADSGIHSYSYVGGASTMLQRAVIYSYAHPQSASYNGADGIEFRTFSYGGSLTDATLITLGTYEIDNSSSGILVANYSDGTSMSLGHTVSYLDVIGLSPGGVVVGGFGAGTYQYTTVGYDLLFNNHYGIYGLALGGAYQYFDVSTYPNTYSGNTYNAYFDADLASTQVVH